MLVLYIYKESKDTYQGLEMCLEPLLLSGTRLVVSGEVVTHQGGGCMCGVCGVVAEHICSYSSYK